ncbi:MAG: acyl carrier protein [Colwellia sp.]
MEHIQQLKDVLSEILNIDTSKFISSTKLLGEISELDSMSIVLLLIEIEKQFVLEIDIEHLEAHHFETFGSLASLIQNPCVI